MPFHWISDLRAPSQAIVNLTDKKTSNVNIQKAPSPLPDQLQRKVTDSDMVPDTGTKKGKRKSKAPTRRHSLSNIPNRSEPSHSSRSNNIPKDPNDDRASLHSLNTIHNLKDSNDGSVPSGWSKNYMSDPNWQTRTRKPKKPESNASDSVDSNPQMEKDIRIHEWRLKIPKGSGEDRRLGRNIRKFISKVGLPYHHMTFWVIKRDKWPFFWFLLLDHIFQKK